MDQIAAINVFVQVAQARSFVVASRSFGISASAVGKTIARLEDQFGVRLLHRSTRSVTLTSEGLLFLERARRILAEFEMAEAELSQNASEPRGLLRVSLPMVGDLFQSVLAAFKKRYPAIDLDVDLTNRQVDLIEEGIDVSVRSGHVQDTRLMTRQLGTFRMALVASPTYLSERGVPEVPDDLHNHDCLRLRMPLSGKFQPWRLKEHSEGIEDLNASVICNDTPTTVALATQGLGVAYLPDFAIAREVSDGRLVCILSDWVIGEGHLRALWPSGRHITPRVRAFIDFLSANLLLVAKATS